MRRLHASLEDVRKAVAISRAMLERVRAVANELERAPLPVPKSHAGEARALLAWMHDGHFVFLGYRYYRLKRGRSRDALVRDADTGLGILRGAPKGHARRRCPSCSPGICVARRATPDLLVLTKANYAVDRASRAAISTTSA